MTRNTYTRRPGQSLRTTAGPTLPSRPWLRESAPTANTQRRQQQPQPHVSIRWWREPILRGNYIADLFCLAAIACSIVFIATQLEIAHRHHEDTMTTVAMGLCIPGFVFALAVYGECHNCAMRNMRVEYEQKLVVARNIGAGNGDADDAVDDGGFVSIPLHTLSQPTQAGSHGRPSIDQDDTTNNSTNTSRFPRRPGGYGGFGSTEAPTMPAGTFTNRGRYSQPPEAFSSVQLSNHVQSLQGFAAEHRQQQ